MIFIKSFFKYYIKALSTSNNTHYKKKKKNLMQHYLPKTICVSYMVLNLTESLDSFLNSSTGANRSTNITKPLCKKSI